MFRPSPATLCASGFTFATGAFFLSGLLTLDLGTTRNMGPGYFPVALGAILVAIAIAILLVEGRFGTARVEEEESAGFSARIFIMILASVLVFAALIGPTGLLPAVFVSTLIAALADDRTRLATGILTSLVVCVFAWAIFKLGLGLPFPALKVFGTWIF